ncbi:tail fiber domain-containing protein [Cetobacterium somerae]|uniref:tail fiber domain-containing protein n=1 Tax=Cetobacterium somerae TaxID=188913 RepID=UPI0039B38B61
MSKYRTIINMSPSFIKVMPFKCTGTNLLKLESYTNRFTNVHEGLVCIFKAENTNTGPIRVKLSDLTNELKLLDVNGNEIPAGFIKSNMYLQASYDGTNLVLHNGNSNISLEAGSNIVIDKKPDGTVVVSAVNTNTWRPITDSLEANDSNTSSSAKVAKILNDKILAITTIVNDNKVLQDNIADTVIEVLTEIDNLKLVDSELTKKITEVNGKADANIREITSIKSELGNKANSNHGHSAATSSTDGFMSKGDKSKLDGIAVGANNYAHPNDENTRHVTDAEKTKWNGKAEGSHGHSTATSSIDGFMSKIDKLKLDGIATGANNYTHPGSGSNPHGTTKGDLGIGNVTNVALNWAWGTANPTHIWGSQGDSGQSFVYNGSQLKYFIGLNNVNNWGASSSIGANSTTEYATTNMVAQVRSEKANNNHTHNHLEINNTETKNVGRLQMFQTSGNTTINPGGGWYSTLRMQHAGYTNGYWQEISLPFDSDNMYFRRNVNGGMSSWRTVWHNGNFDPNSKANVNHSHGYMSDGGSYGTIKLNNWIRTTGNTGWFSESYGGGWYMTDSTWIRTYNNKPIHVAGNDITCTNNIIAYYSDERLKKNFKEINGALNMVMSINPYYYEQNEFAKELGYNEEGKIQIGFKAQEIEKILPQIIQEAPVNHRNDLSDDIRNKIGDIPIKTIDYAKITPLLWRAIQEQQKQIEKLENLLILKGVI